jgi:hypothetical protein
MLVHLAAWLSHARREREQAQEQSVSMLDDGEEEGVSLEWDHMSSDEPSHVHVPRPTRLALIV